MKLKNITYLFFSVLILLLFFKINFRFEESIYCCSDDFDYFIHAETIAEDFDFDYSNQLGEYQKSRFYKNGKSAPVGYVGSGLLAAPFMFLGNIFDKIISNYSSTNDFMNYKLLIYSFSPIFYLLVGMILLLKTLVLFTTRFSKMEFILLFLGSGIIYYSFNRFSMTHTYEYFATSLVLYSSFSFYSQTKNEKQSFVLPLAIMLGFLIRWTNYFLILIPIMAKLMLASNRKLVKNKNFLISSIISVGFFALLSEKIYGFITFDPRSAYQVNETVLNIAQKNSDLNMLTSYFMKFINIFITQEFGILYFMPVLAFTFIYSLISIINFKKQSNYSFIALNTIYILAVSQLLIIVSIWSSTASSYGFRYLLALYPISIIYYYFLKEEKNILHWHKILLLLSVFSISSVLFFEATPFTQLSTERIYNSFDRITRYTQPTYLTGLIKSFFVFEGYLKIFTTSFLGSIFFKLLISIFGKIELINLLESLGLPVSNQDFLLYLDEINIISFDKFLFVIFVFIFIGLYISNTLLKRSN